MWEAIFNELRTKLPPFLIQKLANTFTEHEITADDLDQLTADLLKELGVDKIGHRLLFLRHLSQLKAAAAAAATAISGTAIPWPSRHYRLFSINPSELDFLDKIGEGTYGEVYRGECRGQDVAIKILKDVSRKGLENFRDEVLAISSVVHPNVSMFMGVVFELPMVVTAFEEGGTVDDLLRNSAVSISETQALQMCHQVALGMNWLHSRATPLLHLDLKPSNFLLSEPSPETATVKICDFGMSSLITDDCDNGDGAAHYTRAHGTLPYLSPERLRREPFGKPADVYAFGVSMWQICTRQEPFAGLIDEAELHAAHRSGGGSRRRKRLLRDVLAYLAHEVGDRDRRPSRHELSPVARGLLARYWHSEPAERPDFTQVADQLSYAVVHSVFAEHEPAACEFWCTSFGKRLAVPFSMFRVELLDFAEVWITGESLSCLQHCLLSCSEQAAGGHSMRDSNGERLVTAAGFSLFLSCFGPMSVTTGSNDQQQAAAVTTNFHEIISAFMELCQSGAFFGCLTASAAKALLQNCTAHTWLVRISPRLKNHPFVLSRVDDSGRVCHQRIQYDRRRRQYSLEVANTTGGSSQNQLTSEPSGSISSFLRSVKQAAALGESPQGSPFTHLFVAAPSKGDSYVSILELLCTDEGQKM